MPYGHNEYLYPVLPLPYISLATVTFSIRYYIYLTSLYGRICPCLSGLCQIYLPSTILPPPYLQNDLKYTLLFFLFVSFLTKTEALGFWWITILMPHFQNFNALWRFSRITWRRWEQASRRPASPLFGEILEADYRLKVKFNSPEAGLPAIGWDSGLSLVEIYIHCIQRMSSSPFGTFLGWSSGKVRWGYWLSFFHGRNDILPGGWTRCPLVRLLRGDEVLWVQQRYAVIVFWACSSLSI
jgi:hypothetical protein